MRVQRLFVNFFVMIKIPPLHVSLSLVLYRAPWRHQPRSHVQTTDIALKYRLVKEPLVEIVRFIVCGFSDGGEPPGSGGGWWLFTHGLLLVVGRRSHWKNLLTASCVARVRRIYERHAWFRDGNFGVVSWCFGIFQLGWLVKCHLLNHCRSPATPVFMGHKVEILWRRSTCVSDCPFFLITKLNKESIHQQIFSHGGWTILFPRGISCVINPERSFSKIFGAMFGIGADWRCVFFTKRRFVLPVLLYFQIYSWGNQRMIFIFISSQPNKNEENVVGRLKIQRCQRDQKFIRPFP